VFCLSLSAQPLTIREGRGGLFSVGLRSTISLFNGDQEMPAIGTGGQFRIQLSDRVNTEWFLDYLPTTNQYTSRKDTHIGWSVMFYPLKNAFPKVQPYIVAGHCFDYTKHVDLKQRSNYIERWSSAVQGGLGVHFNLTERFDLTLLSQYMIHLGGDVHSHVINNQVSFEKHRGGSLEGHLLTTLSLNYKLGDLWKSRRK
jgi:hypothetical protein